MEPILLKAAELALQSYSNSIPPGSGIVWHETDNTQWFTVEDYEYQTFWVVFCGTNQLMDWESNIDVRIVDDVHLGFDKALNNVLKEVCDAINAHNHLHPHFVGHSLGGALASLCADRFHKWSPYLWTFGQPRCGNTKWAKLMDERFGDRYTRVFQAGDPVPHLPSVGWFKHAGREVYFDASGKLAKPTPWTRLWNAILSIRKGSLLAKQHDMEIYLKNVRENLGVEKWM